MGPPCFNDNSREWFMYMLDRLTAAEEDALTESCFRQLLALYYQKNEAKISVVHMSSRVTWIYYHPPCNIKIVYTLDSFYPLPFYQEIFAFLSGGNQFIYHSNMYQLIIPRTKTHETPLTLCARHFKLLSALLFVKNHIFNPKRESIHLAKAANHT